MDLDEIKNSGFFRAFIEKYYIIRTEEIIENGKMENSILLNDDERHEWCKLNIGKAQEEIKILDFDSITYSYINAYKSSEIWYQNQLVELWFEVLNDCYIQNNRKELNLIEPFVFTQIEQEVNYFNEFGSFIFDPLDFYKYKENHIIIDNLFKISELFVQINNLLRLKSILPKNLKDNVIYQVQESNSKKNRINDVNNILNKPKEKYISA